MQNRYANNRSIVVLANPKTILDTKHAPAEIRKQVIRADQLIDYIRKVNSEPGATEFSEKDMEELANYFLHSHRECKTDYLEKYRNSVQLEKEAHTIVESEQPAKQMSVKLFRNARNAVHRW